MQAKLNYHNKAVNLGDNSDAIEAEAACHYWLS